MAMGDLVDEVVLIESGVVKVMLPTGTGSDVVTGLYGPGELLGELGVLHFQPRSATVIGHRNGIATHVGGAIFRDLAYHDRDVHALVDATQRRRIHNADQRQLAVASMDVRSRVIRQLSEWAESHGERVDGDLVVRGLSHRDLAGAVLASEKHVDAVLHDLRAAGLVRTSRMCFVLLDPIGQVRRSAERGRMNWK
jgi:CRP-like cAMP-binding protein